MKKVFIYMLLFLVFSIKDFAKTKYLLPCEKKLLLASYDSLLKQVGIKEKSGKNDGDKIEEYLKSVGLFKGYPYCAAGQYWVFYTACKDLNYSLSEIPIYRTGLAIKMYNEGVKKGKKTKFKLQKNDLIFWQKPNIWKGHVERVIKVLKAGWFQTVGFNTSSGIKKSQRDGDGVYIRRRNINHFLSGMLIKGCLGFE